MLEDDKQSVNAGGIENAQPSASDTRPDWDYYDPDEDNVETPEAAEPESEAEDAPEGVETEAAETADTEDDGEKAEAAPVTEDVIVALPTGEKLPVKELIAGYMKDADYRRKTTEVAETRKAVAAEAGRIKAVTDKLTDYIAGMLPDAPDLSLAYSNQGEYVARKALHDAKVAEIAQVLKLAEEAGQAVAGVEQIDRGELLKRENEALAAKFPQTREQKGREAFFAAAQSAAVDLGFDPNEIGMVADHRVYGLAYWAKRGMDADAAAKKAKEKVANVPPVAAPAKRTKPVSETKNRDAMARLARTGSIRDAIAIDWD